MKNRPALYNGLLLKIHLYELRLCSADIAPLGIDIVIHSEFRRFATVDLTGPADYRLADALVDIMKSGKLAGAALDVADPEPLPQDHFLWEAPNLILTPHVSGNMSLPKTCELVIEIFLRNLAHWEKGEPLEHVVDQKQGY